MSDLFTVIDDIYDADGTLPGLLTNDLWFPTPPEGTLPPFGKVEYIGDAPEFTAGQQALEFERIGITGYARGPAAADVRAIRDAIKGCFDSQNEIQDSVAYTFKRIQSYMVISEDGDYGWFFEYQVTEVPG